MKCIIYGFRANNSSQYFYVGSTKQTIKHRFSQHREYTINGRNNNRHFVNKAAKVGWDNIVVDVLAECDCEDRFQIEYDYIQKLTDDGHPLTNIVYRGDQYAFIRQAQSYFDDYELQPYHFVAVMDAYVFGLERNGDKLHDAFCDTIEKLSQKLLTEDIDTYMEMFQEALVNAGDDQEINRQAASIHKRISQMLECC